MSIKIVKQYFRPRVPNTTVPGSEHKGQHQCRGSTDHVDDTTAALILKIENMIIVSKINQNSYLSLFSKI
jgi:hypothetical protein